jgi:hypothetical protein
MRSWKNWISMLASSDAICLSRNTVQMIFDRALPREASEGRVESSNWIPSFTSDTQVRIRHLCYTPSADRLRSLRCVRTCFRLHVHHGVGLDGFPSMSSRHPDVSRSHTFRLMARQEVADRIQHHIVFCANMIDEKTRRTPGMD